MTVLWDNKTEYHEFEMRDEEDMDKPLIGPKELYRDPPTVREKLLPLHSVGEESKDVPDEAWLSPIMSDIRRMPMHTALNMASQIISQLSSEAKVESFDLALAMNRWARVLPPNKGGKVGDNDTQGKA